MLLQVINKIQSESFWLTLCSAFAGAFFAFALNIYYEQRRQFRKNINTLVESEYYLRTLFNFQNGLAKHIRRSQSHYAEKTKGKPCCDIEDFWQSVSQFYVTIKLPDSSKLPLSFLLNEKIMGKTYLEWIFAQNAAFDEICYLLNQRNSLDDEMSKEKVEKSFYTISFLNNLTRKLIKENQSAIQDYERKAKDFSHFILRYKKRSTFFRNFFNL